MKTALLLAAFAFSVVACNTNSADRTTDHPDIIREYETANLDRSELPAEDFTAESVIEAIADSGGLTELPKGVANAVLDNYMSRLASVPAAAILLEDMKIVKEEINSGIISPQDVGNALIRMGAQTRLIAGETGPYAALGSALKASGESMVTK